MGVEGAVRIIGARWKLNSTPPLRGFGRRVGISCGSAGVSVGWAFEIGDRFGRRPDLGDGRASTESRLATAERIGGRDGTGHGRSADGFADGYLIPVIRRRDSVVRRRDPAMWRCGPDHLARRSSYPTPCSTDPARRSIGPRGSRLAIRRCDSRIRGAAIHRTIWPGPGGFAPRRDEEAF